MPTDPTRPPRTTRGLLACLALPVLMTAVALALTYPAAVGAGLAGLLTGALGYHAVRFVVARDRDPARNGNRDPVAH